MEAEANAACERERGEMVAPLRLTERQREKLILALHCAMWWEDSLLDTLVKVEDKKESKRCERNIAAFTSLLHKVNKL